MELYSLGRTMEPATSDGRRGLMTIGSVPLATVRPASSTVKKLVIGASFMSIARGIHGSKLTKFAAYGW